MNLVLGAYMGTVTLAVLVGASLSQLLHARPGAGRYAAAFSAGVMLAICLLYLIPDALAFQHLAPGAAPGSDHVSVGYALSVGFLALLTIERYLVTAHHHGHGHGHDPRASGAHDCARDHEPPHHYQHGPARDLGVAWSTCVALCLHGLFDGVALYAAGVMPAMGAALAVAVILHKVPESATLLSVLRRAGIHGGQRLAAFVLYAAATPVGMVAAAQLLTLLSGGGVALLMAFVAGSLLHLVTGHLLPEATEHDGTHGAFWVMLGGFGMLLAARVLGAG